MIFKLSSRCLFPIINPPLNPLGRLTCLSYSWPAAAANRAEHGVSSTDESDCGSTAYRDARRYARPLAVTWSERLRNSTSFIGTVCYPVAQIATKNGNFGVHTILRVQTSPDSHTSFRILLKMWDQMAERAVQHLKPNDYIYVSGQLRSYTKTALQGVETMRYEVTVRELNYVNQPEPGGNFHVLKSESEHGDSRLEKYRSRLLLWQILFANPNEWYDQRKTKKMPKQPDFKHKSTGEALWLNARDPPWIRQQLDLLDSRFSEEEPIDLARKSFSRCMSDEHLLMPYPCREQG